MTKAIKPPHQSVSTVELFFDLVFVFMVTQLTHLVEHAHGWSDFALAASILVLLWWLYSGWLWLVSTLGVGLQLRVVLIVSMAGFLAMATALPRMETDGIKLFAMAYLAVVLLHSAAFIQFGRTAHVKAIAIMAPVNFGAAAFVLGAAWTRSGECHFWLWAQLVYWPRRRSHAHMVSRFRQVTFLNAMVW